MEETKHYSFVQAVAKRILPIRLFQKIESESKSFVYKCQTCGCERSVWDMGGIRYGARPAQKLATCTNCKNVGFADVRKTSEPDAKTLSGRNKNAG